ncbi:MAG: hypothetical protein Q7J67_09460 [bacterium]|nr:hypothetical protein [bacterium]
MKRIILIFVFFLFLLIQHVYVSAEDKGQNISAEIKVNIDGEEKTIKFTKEEIEQQKIDSNKALKEIKAKESHYYSRWKRYQKKDKNGKDIWIRYEIYQGEYPYSSSDDAYGNNITIQQPYTSFSVGDRVKYVGPKKGLVGEKGTVIKNMDKYGTSNYSRKIQVRFDNRGKKTLSPVDLEKVE